MDVLGNPGAALEAFQDAAHLTPGGSVREDADARTVEALGALGDIPRCRGLREAFLTRFPGSVHAARVRALCEPAR